MKKVFISQPMGDKTTEEIIKERDRVKKELEEKLGYKIEIIDSFFNSHFAHPPLYYLGRAIEMMADADLVYFVKGWEKSRGCQIEHQCAILYQYNWREEG